MNNFRILDKLKEYGEELLAQKCRSIDFTSGNQCANALLNDLNKYPHAFVIACLMDRQWKAENCWLVPFRFKERFGSFEFCDLKNLSAKKVLIIFTRNQPLHRLTNVMADVFYQAIQTIKEKYECDASTIWKGKPNSATIVKRFLEFKGAGIKIATMAVNILVRDFEVCVKEKLSIDVSPDAMARRVSERLGVVRQGAKEYEFLYTWRELNPEYPGIFDQPLWEIGRNWCHPKRTLCEQCYMRNYCSSARIE